MGSGEAGEAASASENRAEAAREAVRIMHRSCSV